MSRSFLVLAAAAAVGCAAIGACSANDGETPPPGGGGPGGSGASASGGSNTGGTGGGLATGGGGSGTGGGCVGTSSTAKPIALDIFLMLDQSGSMLQGAGNGQTKWDAVKGAIGAFVQDITTAGIGLGIQYFGLPQPFVAGCSQFPCTVDSDCTNGCTVCMPQGLCQAPFNPDIDSCDAIDYAWADVPIQVLPGVGAAILGSMGMHAPGTNTPTQPALQGAIDYATAWQIAHPDHLTVVAFATDGDPSECDIDPAHIDAIAAAGFAGTPSIETFVIGVGPSLMALDGIAAAGGTTSAFHVDLNAMATQNFLDAMNSIRHAAVGCTYEIPPAPPGRTLDYGLVNVAYKPGSGDPDETIPKVDNLLGCSGDGEGWYYDDNAAPTQIILCDGTCARISTDPKAEVDVVLGCQTILK